MSRIASLLFCLLVLPSLALAQIGPAEMEKGRKMFREFMLLEQSYNPNLIDLYADEANIYTTVILEGGEREFHTKGKAFKEALAPYLHTARNVGEWFAYTNVTVVPEGRGLRILASRTSHLSDETYPYQMLVAPGPGGRWLIYEERSVVRPVNPPQ